MHAASYSSLPKQPRSERNRSPEIGGLLRVTMIPVVTELRLGRLSSGAIARIVSEEPTHGIGALLDRGRPASYVDSLWGLGAP